MPTNSTEPLYLSPGAQVAVPEGWQLVPIEPTAEMCHVYGVTHFDTGSHREALKAALAAAPKQGEQE